MSRFKGEYNHQLDAKNRIRIPAKLKGELGSGYTVTRGLDKCLYILPADEWDKLSDRMSGIDMFDAEGQKFVRSVSKLAYEPDEDPQGRLVLSDKLRKYAEITKDIVFLGAGSKIEIWSQEVYDSYFADEDYSKTVSTTAKVKHE